MPITHDCAHGAHPAERQVCRDGRIILVCDRHRQGGDVEIAWIRGDDGELRAVTVPEYLAWRAARKA